LKGKIGSHRCHCGSWGCIGLALGSKGELVVYYRLEGFVQDKGRYHHRCDLHVWKEDGMIGPLAECSCVEIVENAVDPCIQVTFNGKEECECRECVRDRDFAEIFNDNENIEDQFLVRARSESM